MPAGPNTAFVLTIFGLLGIYSELVWPGYRVVRIVSPGVFGLGMVLTGGYFLWLHAPTAVGLRLLGGAAALFAVDAILNCYFIAGVAWTALLAMGFWKLFGRSQGITAELLFPLCVIFGAATVFLSHGAKRARRNKRVGTFPSP